MTLSKDTDVQAFVAARDRLLALREDADAAASQFRWPTVDRFNWALDFFDTLPRDQTALWLVNGDGSDDRCTFGELSERSNRVANFLRTLGVRRGDRILLVLGNSVPLWETMLAAMKLGAVVIPATTLLTADDLYDRVDRGQAKAIVAKAGLAARFEGIPGADIRIAVGGEAPAGTATPRQTRRTPPSRRTARPAPAILCCCTSRQARRRDRSSSSTPTPATRSGTSRRCTGSACSRATFT